MVVAQKLKEAEITEQGALLLTRNLLRIAIFNISYIRGLFPENYFNDKSVPALEMKIKKLMPMDAESRRLIDWMEKGVYDALQTKYLKTLLVCVCETVEGPMIEEYTFSFSHSNSESQDVSMDISRSGNKKEGGTFKCSSTEEITPSQMRSSACKMVRTLVQLMRTLDRMPEERTILIKILYYDDLTPAEYEPPFFRGCSEEEARNAWTKSPLKMEVGNVNSKHLVLTLKALYHALPMQYVSIVKLQNKLGGEANQTTVRKFIDRMAQDGFVEAQGNRRLGKCVPLRPYVDHLISLCEKMDALPEPQRLEVYLSSLTFFFARIYLQASNLSPALSFCDSLKSLLQITCTDYFQLLSQTLMDNLEAEPSETFEKVQPVMDNPKAEHTQTFEKGTSEYIQEAPGVENVYSNGTVGRGGSSSSSVSMGRAWRPVQNGINGARNPPAPGGANGPGGGAPQPPHPLQPLQPPQLPAMLPVIRNTYFVQVFAGFIDRAAFPTADLLHAEVLRLLSATDEIPLPLRFAVLYHTSYDDDFIQVDGPYNELADEHVQQILFVVGNDDEVDPPPEGYPPWYPPWHVG